MTEKAPKSMPGAVQVSLTSLGVQNRAARQSQIVVPLSDPRAEHVSDRPSTAAPRRDSSGGRRLRHRAPSSEAQPGSWPGEPPRERTRRASRSNCMGRRLIAVVFALLLASGCSDSDSPTGSLADHRGVLGCADLVVWGTIYSAEPVNGQLKVALNVEEWVYPATGDSRVTVSADDPAVEVGAPTWEPGPESVLVIVSEVGPTERYSAAEGKQAVQEWRDAGSPRMPADHCRDA
jgi:hypothetical protein